VPASDVTAVLLTLGETSTARARDSVRAQTFRPADVVTVSGVTPFFKALTEGVALVETPFLLQVDADMVLHRTCLERLRASMTPETGIAVGQLRDPLIGTISGVKLFRRECFDDVALRDSVTPDVDFSFDLLARGWLTLHPLWYGPDAALRAFGDHLPDFTPTYTYATYALLGSRYFLRRNPGSLLWRYRALRGSTHQMARLARIAMLAGIFLDQDRNVPKSEIVAAPGLLDGLAAATARPRPASLPDGVDGWFALGREILRRGEIDGASGLLTALDEMLPATAWQLEAAFCAGLGAAPTGPSDASGVARRLAWLADGQQ
jgi:hypothetical protein